ncbi:MAG: DUF1501 domain-containing protein [Planctomycetes bacterium]|nr:DUF1501 domain-containing protein [Planctomycetota bacterium]
MSTSIHLTRRGFIGMAAGAGFSLFDQLRLHGDELRRQGKSCILLWMAGGPSQFETFDPKPGAETQGPTRAMPTATPGIAIAEHWRQVARVTGDLAVIRSMTSREGNHGRATYLLHTSYAPSGGVVHPGVGSIVAKELGQADFDLPNFVSIQGASIGPSFLGVQHAPFIVLDPNRAPDNLAAPVPDPRLQRRLGLMRELEQPFAEEGAGAQVRDHQTLYGQTARLVLSPRVRGFDLEREPARVRDHYGRSPFGQGCLMARRLVEEGVPFVEVQSPGWDTHGNELRSLQRLIPPVDQGMAALIGDLRARGLLERTLVIWMGEFGRTPRVNVNAGRDHFPQAFNLALAGCGVRGGQVIGATNRAGTEVADRPVSVPDLFVTIYRALGINSRRENQSNVGRPLRLVEGGNAVGELWR